MALAARSQDFVKTEWPQYWETYAIMPHPVMRADLFRYLILLRYGGIYTDVDTECMVQLLPPSLLNSKSPISLA